MCGPGSRGPVTERMRDGHLAEARGWLPLILILLAGREAANMIGMALRAATTGRRRRLGRGWLGRGWLGRGWLGSGRLGAGGGAGFALAACAALVLAVPAGAAAGARPGG